jgi:hypothetical protein
MAMPAYAHDSDHNSEPVPPEAEPEAIRACLSSQMRYEFDREWQFALDEAKQSYSLTAVTSLLLKWRHIAYGELKEPGSYYRIMAKAETILRTGKNPDAVSVEDVRALIRQRLGK